MMMSSTPDSIIMGKIVEIASSQTSPRISDFIAAIAPKIPAIILMIAMKKLLENTGDMYSNAFTSIKKTLKVMFYTTIVLQNSQAINHLDYHMRQVFASEYLSLNSNLMFPMYEASDDDECNKIYYLRWHPSHRSFIDRCKKLAEDQLSDHIASANLKVTSFKSLKLTSKGLGYQPSKPMQLYPSRNYKELVELMKTHIRVSDIVHSHTVLGVMINGVPGLGKTKFADFVVTQKIVSAVYKVDMTTMLEYPFKEAIKHIYHNIEIVVDTMFMIDEIDKYIDFRIEKEYKALQNSKQPDEPQPSEETPLKANSNTIDSSSFEEFRRHSKTAFLYDLLSVLERDGLSHSVIVIFCCNNFHSIFEDIDITHHRSLYDRFMKVRFNECDIDEVVGYIDHYNRMFEGTDLHANVTKDDLYEMLNSDISITHRALHHISVKTKYNAFAMIDELNAYVAEEDSGEALSQKIANIKKDRERLNNAANSLASTPILGNSDKNSPRSNLIYSSEVESDDDSSSEGLPPIVTMVDDPTRMDASTVADFNRYHKVQLPTGVCNEEEWKREYPPLILLDTNEKERLTAKTKEYLELTQKAITTDERKRIVREMFDFLAADGSHLINANEGFKSTVSNKIAELLHQHPDLFNQVSPQTKKFINILCSEKK